MFQGIRILKLKSLTIQSLAGMTALTASLLSLSACGNALSASGEMPLNGGSPGAAAPNAQMTQPNAANPVRISRTFFQGPVNGTLQVVQADGTEVLSNQSAISWQEYPTTLPPPRPGAIADDRDFKACAQFKDGSGAELCFNVMPDVSSVGVNGREMSLQGLGGQFGQVSFVSADRSASGYTILFQAQGSQGPVRIQVGLSQL